MQLHDDMRPIWYYAAGALTGVVGWVAVSMSSLSDVMPPQWRAASFGMIMAGFSIGFAIAPQLALLLGHLYVSIFSLVCLWTGLAVVVFCFPETVPEETALEAREARAELLEGKSTREKIAWFVYRPIWELSILNRSRLFRLLSCLAFFSGMVSSGE